MFNKYIIGEKKKPFPLLIKTNLGTWTHLSPVENSSRRLYRQMLTDRWR